MTTDIETDIVYFSDLLPKRHPVFFKRMSKILNSTGVKYGLLPDTKDIWCRDYMPVQVSKDHFVQFKFKPSYLCHSKKYLATITDSDKACKAIGIKPVISDIKIDGGNVVKSGKWVIMTERVFKENLGWSKVSLVKEIEKLLKVKQVIIIPDCPGDEFGHADGIVRFIEATNVDSGLVFVTNLLGISRKYFLNLKEILWYAGLTPISLPYDHLNTKNKYDATGIYVNFIQVGKIVIYPSFGIKEDVLAKRNYQNFLGSNAVALRSNEIAEEGGVLNCISWNVYQGKKIKEVRIKRDARYAT